MHLVLRDIALNGGKKLSLGGVKEFKREKVGALRECPW
jgi:hypothetical protein